MQKVICNIKKVFSLRPVLAEEVVAGAEPVVQPTVVDPVAPLATVQPVVTSQPLISFEQLIAQARQEEKSKLYPEITSLKADKVKLTKDLNDALLQLGTKEATIMELRGQLEVAKTGTVDPEEVRVLKEKIVTLETENNVFKSEAEQASTQKLREAEILKYEGKVIPELVTGTTVEEIAESVKASNARYLEITGGVVGAPQTQAPTNFQTPPLVGGFQSPTFANPVVDGVGFDNRVVTDSMIRNMSATEYASWRKQAGLK